MNKLLLTLAAVIVVTRGASAATIDDIRFRAPFDGSLDAEMATGKPKPNRVTGELKYEVGRFGQALVGGEQGAVVEYRIESNLDVKQGALSMWINPVNWQPGEKRSHVLLRFRHGSIFRLFIDEAGRLVFEAGPDLVETCRASTSITHLKQGEWAQIVVTWSAKQREVRLYTNGTLRDAVACEERFLPLVVNFDYQVGDIPRARGRQTPRKTLIDDLTIYRRPILPDEFGRIETGSSARKAPEYETPLISIRKAPSFNIDGRIDEAEAANATTFGSFLNVSDHKLASIQTVVHCGYTDDTFYVGVQSPILPGIALKASTPNHDGPVWNDDAVQLHLAPPHGNSRFHFITNSKGVIFDRRETIGIKHDATWNGKWQVANRTDGGTWVMEMAVRFADLGLEPPKDGEKWRMNVTRDRVDPRNLSCWPKLSSFADTDKHGHVRFVGDGPAISVPRIGPVLGGRLAVDGTITGDKLSARLVASRGGSILLENTSSLVAFDEQVSGATPDCIDLRVAGPGAVDTEYFRQVVPLGQSQTTLRANFNPVPSSGICSVSITEQDPDVLKVKPSAVADLVRVGETNATRTIRFNAFTDGNASASFDIATLPSAEYELRVRVEHDGRILDQATAPFIKPHEPWRHLKVGHSDTPPPPWTPMQIKQGDGELEIACWNRTHLFRGPLPATIDNGGNQQLAAPIHLDAKIAGDTLTWSDARIHNVRSTDTKATFDATMTAGPLSAKTQAYMEYDGMMWYEITVSPKTPTKLDALDLVIPIKAKFASLMHTPGDFYNTGKTGKTDGWTFDHDAHWFFMWLGNEDLGFTWFYERPSQKRFADKDKFVRLERRGDQVLLKVRYIDQPITLDEPFTLQFGLQATPVRSRPKGWRSWGEPRPVGNSISIPWTDEHFDRYGAGFPEATSPASYTRFVASRKRYGRVAPYKILLWHGIQSPEWQYNAPDWDLGGGVNKYSDTRRFWWGGRVCGAADTFIDFITWKYRAHIHEHNLDGVYHDLQWSYRCGNANHGCAPSRRSIRGDRELNKRLYTTLKQFDRPVIKIDHASNLICSAFSAYGDVFTTGEEMCSGSEEPKKPHHRVWDNYFRVMSIAYFKACTMGRQWGVVPMFLLQMKQPNDAATEAIFSILLAHDAIPTWDAWAKDIGFMARLWRLLEDFNIGHDSIEFLPYWHDTTPAKVTEFTPHGGGPIRPVKVDTFEPKPWQTFENDETYGASIYHLPGQRSLVVVYNYAQDDATAVVNLDLDAMGFDPSRTMATDAFMRFKWVQADQPIELDIKHRNFRLIWVEQRDDTPDDAFPDQQVSLQKLAGERKYPGEDGRSGEQIVGDLWERPFAEDDGHTIAAAGDAMVAVTDGKDRGDMSDHDNFTVSVYGPHMPMRNASQAVWNFDLRDCHAIESAQLVVDLRLDNNNNPQVEKMVRLGRAASNERQSPGITWANRPNAREATTFTITKDTPLGQWRTYTFDVMPMVRDAAGGEVALTMAPMRPDIGHANYTLLGRRRDHPDEAHRAARLLVRGLRHDPYRPNHPTGTEVAIVFELDKPTKLERIDIRMREAGVRGPDTREPMQLRIVGVDDTGLPTDREVINARSFAWPWLNTAWSYKAFNLKQSRMLPAGRYAAVMFKTPEPNGEHYHAEVPIFPAKAGDAYLATRIMPGGAWQKQATTTSFGVFGHTAP